jgi:hypothetical protein
MRAVIARSLAGGLLSAVLAGMPVAAHELPKHPVRELLRIQGFRAPAPAGVTVARELTVIVLGQPVRFAANEWRSFAFFDATGEPTPVEPATVTLQGERQLLRKVTTARPDQRITILAERRPGQVDLFVLSIDRCPE